MSELDGMLERSVLRYIRETGLAKLAESIDESLNLDDLSHNELAKQVVEHIVYSDLDIKDVVKKTIHYIYVEQPRERWNGPPPGPFCPGA